MDSIARVEQALSRVEQKFDELKEHADELDASFRMTEWMGDEEEGYPEVGDVCFELFDLIRPRCRAFCVWGITDQ